MANLKLKPSLIHPALTLTLTKNVVPYNESASRCVRTEFILCSSSALVFEADDGNPFKEWSVILTYFYDINLKVISKISVDSNFTFTSYAWLSALALLHKLLCWIKSCIFEQAYSEEKGLFTIFSNVQNIENKLILWDSKNLKKQFCHFWSKIHKIWDNMKKKINSCRYIILKQFRHHLI